jgi:hypothetical protein
VLIRQVRLTLDCAQVVSSNLGRRGKSFMQRGATISHSRDILSSPWPAFAWFWLPGIAIAITWNSGFGSGWRTVVWTVALIILGAACIANAIRCGRIHCYLTGPFFLVMAVVTLLYGLGSAPSGARGWNVIGLTILLGAIALCCLPELFLGKYRKDPSWGRCTLFAVLVLAKGRDSRNTCAYFNSVMMARCLPRTRVSLCVRGRALNLTVPAV